MNPQNPIPYGRHWIDDQDIQAVVEVLRSDWITTGPQVREFEQAVAQRVGSPHAVAMSNGTAGLHAAMAAIGIGPGDEVILPSLTFVATANAVVLQGGTPIFADVDPDTLLLDPAAVEHKITSRTKAIVAVDYAGQPCDYQSLGDVAERRGVSLVADACHALGAEEHGQPVGSLADLTVFSFHPVKAVTAGEGGMVVTNHAWLADRLRRFRNHGISTDHRQRMAQGTWYYEMVSLGMNYRLSDIQCALGLSQLSKLESWVSRRQALAARYDAALSELPGVRPLATRAGVTHAYHLYVVQLDLHDGAFTRSEVFHRLRAEGVGVQVHYIPVHLQPFYRQKFGTGPGLCPTAEAAYERLLTLPLYPMLTEDQVDHVVDVLAAIFQSEPLRGGRVVGASVG